MKYLNHSLSLKWNVELSAYWYVRYRAGKSEVFKWSAPTFCSGTRWWIGCLGQTGHNQSRTLLLSNCTFWFGQNLVLRKSTNFCFSWTAVGFMTRYMVGGVCLKGLELLVRITHPLREAPRPESQSRQGSLRAKPSYPSQWYLQIFILQNQPKVHLNIQKGKSHQNLECPAPAQGDIQRESLVAV